MANAVGDLPAASAIREYSRQLQDRLCWLDSTPTHASSGQQRQCPKCRTKWSYDRLALELAALEQFCLGRPASEAARKIGCAKNTMLHHYSNFRRAVENLVSEMLTNGEIATNPITIRELRSLEKALRAGSDRRRGKACLHLFLCRLNFQERQELLFRRRIVPEIHTRREDAAKRLAARSAGKVETERDIRYAALRGGHRMRTVPPTSREKWRSLFREVRARFDPDCPYPSAACKRLVDPWVKTWEQIREMLRR